MALEEKTDPTRAQDDDDAALQKQIQQDEVKASFLGLYRYASTPDIIIVALSAVCAVLAGACQPLPTVRRRSIHLFAMRSVASSGRTY
jgi:ATP-binding cassette subfamily B (MDR/TAP) protein 1